MYGGGLDNRHAFWLIRDMDELLEQLRADASPCVVEQAQVGYILTRVPEAADAFNALVRDLLNRAGEEFVVLPTTDGSSGYDRAVLLPL